MIRLRPCVLAALVLGCSDATGPSPKPNLAQLVLGSHFACSLKAGDIACWGRGDVGQLGLGVAPIESTPELMPSPPALGSLAGGYSHMCGLEANGQAWCWGSNLMGELGSTVPDQQCGADPCQMSPVPTAPALRFKQLALGVNFTCGLATDGRVYCWGLNDTGQLGTANTGTGCGGLRCSPTPVLAAGGKRFATIAAGRSYLCGLTPDGTGWCWGYESLPLPNGHPNPSFMPDPRKVTGAPRFVRISAGGYHTCALTPNDEAWCWGIDALGAGPSKLESAVPVKVSGGHRFQEIAVGRITTCGLERSGAVYCWGANGNGEIGNPPVGSTIRFEVPTAISSPLRFVDLAGEGGAHNYCGVTTGGDTVCWGKGTEGELGSGNSDSITPIIVSLPTSLSS